MPFRFLLLISLVVIGISIFVCKATRPSKVEQDVTEVTTLDRCTGHYGPACLCDLTANLQAKENFNKMSSLARVGNSVAQCTLGYAYKMGYVGVKPDMVMAKQWLLQSAEQNNSSAQLLLAQIYEGSHLPQDNKEALVWYNRAAEQGDSSAQEFLAWSYQNGVHVEHNDAKAVKWWLRAANQGNLLGAVFLAESYRDGAHGLSRNLVQAYAWRCIANHIGEIWSAFATIPQKQIDGEKRYLAEYEQGMTPEQIEEAKSIAQQWRLKDEQESLTGK